MCFSLQSKRPTVRRSSDFQSKVSTSILFILFFVINNCNCSVIIMALMFVKLIIADHTLNVFLNQTGHDCITVAPVGSFYYIFLGF